MSASEPAPKLQIERISRAGYSCERAAAAASTSAAARKYLPIAPPRCASLAKLRTGAMLQKSELFARLAEGHKARITVVTPNQRLAHSLTLEFDDYQLARDLTSWEAADILPFGAFVERLWEDALYSDVGEKLPLLLTPAQEQHLWERILAASGLLIVPQAAAQCREAWRFIHQWRIPSGPGNEDALAFAHWSAAYRKATADETDAARLPDLMAGYLEHVKKPALIVAYGFDVMPPQTREFLSRFAWVECAPPPVAGRTSRAS